MDKKDRNALAWAAFTVLATVMAAVSFAPRMDLKSVPYSEFERQLQEGRFSEVTVGDRLMTGKLKTPQADGTALLAAAPVEAALADRLRAQGVVYERVHDPAWLPQALSWLLPALLMVGVFYYAGRRGGGTGGLLNLGRAKAKVFTEVRPEVRFEDVAGVDEAKAELQEIVEFLKDPQRQGRLGARVPKGVLLMGPTGTGKTLLARAVAGEAGVTFLSISGSEFIEVFVGVGAARVRDLFEQARASAPAIIFIDELDALGKARGPGSVTGGVDEREQTLNQLLVELDGFDPSVGVVLLAATNRPETLDPALLRAGRFDRQVLVDRPDRAGRAAILQVHARRIKLASDVDLDEVAAITVGLAGADLANVVNEAAVVATRRDAAAVTLSDFTQAIERIVAGVEKKHRLISPRERELVATHELGHAVTALSLPGVDRVHKVSIIPRGVGALGYTMQRPSEDRHVLRRAELADRLAVLLGGRAAEQLFFGEPSTGAADDLAKATDIARDMVLRWGMDEQLGPVAYADAPATFLGTRDGSEPHTGSPVTAQRIDEAVRTLLEEAMARATAILADRQPTLAMCIRVLMEQETLDEAELMSLLGPDAPVHASPSRQPDSGAAARQPA